MKLGEIKVNDLCTALRERATLLTTLGEKEDNPTVRVRTLIVASLLYSLSAVLKEIEEDKTT